MGGAVIPAYPPDEALRRWRVLFITYRRQLEQLDGRDPAVLQVVNNLTRVYTLVSEAEKIRQDILAQRNYLGEPRIRELEFRRSLESASAEIRAGAQKLRDLSSLDASNPLAYPFYPLAAGLLSLVLLIAHFQMLSQLRKSTVSVVEVQTPLPFRHSPPPDTPRPDLFPVRDLYFEPNGMEQVRRLAGRVAHNFNNLLTTINGYSDLLLHSLDESDPNRKDIEHIKVAGDRAAFLAAQLLAFSGKQVAKPAVVDLNQLLRNLESSLRPLTGPQIELDMNLSPELANVQIDKAQIEQVLLGLVVNARDAMPFGGSLYISTRNAGNGEIGEAPRPCRAACVILSVRDTGVGMEDETRDQIFEPFFTTREPGKGTGLGLSTAYGIVRQNGGTIRVRTGPGNGSTFDIYFPVTRANNESWTRLKSNKSRFTLNSLRESSPDQRP